MSMFRIQPIVPGMNVDSWIVSVVVENLAVHYGPFTNVEDSTKWAAQLKGQPVISPVYSTGYNRG